MCATRSACFFGAVGLLLAAIGIYGATAYAVSQRTREIGVRVALGAQRAHVLRLIVRQSMGLGGLGLVIGVAMGAVATRLLSSLLFGVGATDPATCAGVCALFTAVTLAASYFPRAVRCGSIRWPR